MASATDVITYIGVPLAVLGVLPILYNSVITLAIASRVRRLLRHSHLSGITRGDIINRIIEVDLPRYTITPWDRESESDEYWSVSRQPSMLAGGSWTTLNWRANVVGMRTQRVEYVDQVRQPQAEISFEDLICYLLDLGAIPNPAGFRMLRTSGLWVPVGTALFLSPDRREAVLTIAPLEDSDGLLSLAVRWSQKWAMRDKSSMPPYWLKLSPPVERLWLAKKPAESEGQSQEQVNEAQTTETSGQNEKAEASTGHEQLDAAPPYSTADAIRFSRDRRSKDMRSIFSEYEEEDARPVLTNMDETTFSLRCHISARGLTKAIPEDRDFQTYHPLAVRHLEIPRAATNTNTAGMWFASGATTHTADEEKAVLWNYDIPEAVLALARAPVMPCGVMEELRMVDSSTTPSWATEYDESREESEYQMRRMRDSGIDRQTEMRLTGAALEDARRARQRREFHEFVDHSNERKRIRDHRDQQRQREALQSPRWHAGLLAPHLLKWLAAEGLVTDAQRTVRELAGSVLFAMVRDAAFARSMAAMLDQLQAWADSNTVGLADVQMLCGRGTPPDGIEGDPRRWLAYAIILLSNIRASHHVIEGGVAADLQECLAIWKVVRLG